MTDKDLSLRAGALTVELRPSLGGAVTAFHARRDGRRIDLMRPLPPGSDEVLAAACFPLVPFSGRIAHGRLRFAGREHALPLNLPGEPSALHGQGWQQPWQVLDCAEDRALLGFEYAGPGWPWPYRAQQAVRLREGGLSLELSVTNLGAEPMPAGIGLHPWFIATPDARLAFAAGAVWLVDAENLYRETVAVPPHWDFSAGCRLAGTGLVNGFSGWNGRAAIDWPEWQVRLAIEAGPPLSHLVVYTPAGRDFFCVEPVSHAVDAFNLAARGVTDTGTFVLAPGETLCGEARFLPQW